MLSKNLLCNWPWALALMSVGIASDVAAGGCYNDGSASGTVSCTVGGSTIAQVWVGYSGGGVRYLNFQTFDPPGPTYNHASVTAFPFYDEDMQSEVANCAIYPQSHGTNHAPTYLTGNVCTPSYATIVRLSIYASERKPYPNDGY
jgi:hypothetical protein